MQDITLELEKRDVLGKQVKHLRTDGIVPAVIHDHGKESIVVQGSYTDMHKVYLDAGKNHTVALQVGKQKYMAMIKHADIEPRKHRLRHLVFNAVKANEKVDAEVPVKMRLAEGNESTPAERKGLVVLSQLEAVEIEALPKNLPEILEYDGEKLAEAGDTVTVADLEIPEGVTVTTEATHAVATVYEPSALAAANDAAGGDADEQDIQEVAEGPGTDEKPESEGESSED